MENYFATTARGLEDLLDNELAALGALEIRRTVAGAHFRGGLETAYRVCLWSRLAARVFLPLAEFEINTADIDEFRRIADENRLRYLVMDHAGSIQFPLEATKLW